MLTPKRMFAAALAATVSVCLLFGAVVQFSLVLRAKFRTLPAVLPVPVSLQFMCPAVPGARGAQEGMQPVCYPTDALFCSKARAAYKSGSMTLCIPALGLSSAVQNGTSEAALAQGVGLYETAQLPCEDAENPNVSLAAHSGAAGCEFYGIETLGNGDTLYLDYCGVRYTYTWVESGTVQDTDWSPVYCRDYASVTLTSCTTPGAGRVYVVGRLVRTQPI